MGAGMTLAKRRLMLNEPHLETAQSDGILTMDTDMRAPLKALRVGVEPVQDLHGYDKPWPAGGGKNKLDQSAYTSLEEQTTFSNGKFTSNYAHRPTNTMVRTFLNGSTVKSILSSITVGTRTSLTITVDSTWDSMFIGFRTNGIYNAGAYFAKPSVDDGTYTVSFYVDSATSGDMAFSNVQFESGSTATSFAPYSNICPISGWTGCEVKHSGADVSAPTTVLISWSSSVGTVYGGYLTWNWDGTVTLTKTRVLYNLQSFSGVFGVTPNGYAVYRSMPRSRDVTATSNLFRWSTNSYTQMPIGTFGGGSGVAETWSFILPSSITSIAEANEWLQNNPTQICYRLATPETITLTPQEALRTLRGENNIWSDANGAISATYWKH